MPVRRFRSPHTLFPHAQFLSNGNYVAVVTNAGGGASFWRGLRGDALARATPTRDPGSQFIYLRDVRSGAVWSATYQPTRARAGRLPRDVPRRAGDASAAATTTSRRSSTSRSRPKTTSRCGGSRSPTTATRIREIEVTSYAEIVLAPAADDLAHPAFGKLFVETEYLPESAALLCHRRPRDPRRAGAWAVHVLSLEGRAQGPVEWETDRARFLGRGRGPDDPAGARRPRALGHDRRRARSDRQPAAADPARARAASCGCAFATGMASDRETAEALAQKYHDPSAAARTFALAFTHAQSGLRHLGISSDEALLFERLASRVLCTDGSLRAGAGRRWRRTRSARPACGRTASPAICPSCSSASSSDDDVPLVRQVLQAQEYWRLKGLSADVVILNEHPVSYLDEMHAQLDGAARRRPVARVEAPARRRVSAARATAWASAERVLLAAVARGRSCSGDRGDLADAARSRRDPARAASARRSCRRAGAPAPTPRDRVDRRRRRSTLANGLGGFADDGREYVDRARRRRGDAAAVGERHRQPALRHDGHRVGLGAHLVGEQPREPADAVRQRSGDRPDGRGALHPRRRDGRRRGRRRRARCRATPASGRFVIRHAAGVTRFSRVDARHRATSSTSSSTRTIR